MKKISNVRAIRFSVAFNGNGCVNWDSSEQKSTLEDFSLFGGSIYKNLMFAKKEFSYDENGEAGFKYKVSSECLRHNIFRKSMPFVVPYDNTTKDLLPKMHAQPDYIIRGYMATRKGSTTIKRKSPFTISDAVENTEILRKFADFDFHSNAGSKGEKEEEESNTDLYNIENDSSVGDKGEKKEEKSNTSLYKLENVGSMEYIAECNLDVEELSFISCDPRYDRQAFDNEEKGKNENIYLKALSESMVNFTPEVKRYSLDNDIFQITDEKNQRGEEGVLLNKESVDMLIHRLFNLIKDVNIYKRNAMFEFKEFVSIKVVTENGIVDIKSEDLEDCVFEYAEAYKQVH